MAIRVNATAFASGGTQTVSISSMFVATASNANPTYLVLTALDRNEYTANATGATGGFTGNGHVAGFAGTGDDGRAAGIVFTYQTSTGRYYSSTYGYLDQIQYLVSASSGDVTNISLFATSDSQFATAYTADPYALMQLDPGGYVGSTTVVTQPGFNGAVPAQATPQSIASVAKSFVGDAWNMDGCWTLASTIAAEAGAALPVQTTEIGLPGQANGEWIVAFNGPAGSSGNWQSMIMAGEMIVFQTGSGGGHITTCVSGSGTTAMLVDNITYENAAGQITNLANDGSSADVVVAAPHIATEEWAGVPVTSVVIYELDTPLVTAKVATDSIASKGTQTLSSLFSATDPANRAIVSYQVYDAALVGSFVVNGVIQAAHNAATALTVGSLASTTYVAGANAGADTIDIRAFNGSYWNDWQALSVTVTAVAPAAPPLLTVPTAAQTWAAGQQVALSLAANTFTDPQGQTLRFSATQANGQALPGWLSFNAQSDSFSGTAPITPQTLGLKVTATDTSGLSVSESFTATILPTGPVLANQTQDARAIDGQPFSLSLPANTFTDASSQQLSDLAYQIAGPRVTSWLHFNAGTATLYGTAPISAVGTARIEILATDGNHKSASEAFNLSFGPPVTTSGFDANAVVHVNSAVAAFATVGFQS